MSYTEDQLLEVVSLATGGRKPNELSTQLLPTPILGEYGHARLLQDTYDWVQTKLHNVPITRVYDATPLDHLGLPVWAAVTPLASDLTVHAGKGLNALASRLSAIMEAIERVSGESVESNRLIRGSYNELLRRGHDEIQPLDPQLFDLPFNTAYAPDASISWIAGYDLMQRCDCLIPLDLVISPPTEGVCQGLETNGFASGNNYVEAIVHGVCELIERDAKSHDEFNALFCDSSDIQLAKVKLIDLSTLPDEPRSWVDRLQERGLQLRLQVLENSANLPAYGAFIVDEMFPGNEGYPMIFGGYGCDLNPTRAALRALSEAVQSHTIVMLGARDEFEGTRAAPDRSARLLYNLQLLHPTSYVGFEAAAELTSGDLLDDLKTLLEKLSAAGFEHCIAVDLARKTLDVPVVRILVPGLSGPYGYTTKRPNIRLLLNLV